MERIFIFAGGWKTPDDLPELFNQELLKSYQTQQPPVEFIFSDFQLYRDDTIEVVKQKICLTKNQQNSPHEIYLFCWKLLPKPVKDQGIPLEMFLKNIDLPSSEIATMVSYERLAHFANQHTLHIAHPMGPKKQHWKIPVNPFLVDSQPTHTPSADSEQGMSTSMLLHYGSIIDNPIFLCWKDDVMKNKQEYESAMTPIYYPFHSDKGPHANNHLSPITHKFHQLYYQRSEDIVYSHQGIASFTMVMNFANHRKWPLEIIFKQLHSSLLIPFVMLNPGKLRENVVRMHCNNVSTNGKLIPIMTKKEVMKVATEFGNPTDTISAYIPIAAEENKESAKTQTVQNELFIIINKLGHVFVKAIGKHPMSYEQWNRILLNHLNTYLAHINDITQQAGYVMNLFEDMRDERMTKMNYTMSLPVQDPIQLARHIPCITEMFDIYNDDVSNDHPMYLKYKRTGHFEPAEGQKKIIQFIRAHHKVHDRTMAIASLVLNYSLPSKEAERMFDEFVDADHDDKASGFPVHMTLVDNQLTILVENITAVDYVHELFIYLDGIVRLTQQSLSHTSLLSHKDICTSEPTKKGVVHIPSVELPEEEETTMGEDDMENFYGMEDQEDQEEEVEEVEPVNPILTKQEEKVGASTGVNLDGLSLNGLFLNRMQQRDPALFVYDNKGYMAYSRMCSASAARQPIILTEDEYRDVETNHRDSYTEAIKYGSSEDHQHYYICPRYWCMKTKRPMSEAEVQDPAKKCGNIIPRDAKHIPKGAYIYEFSSDKHRNEAGDYVMHTPEFLKQKKNPLGLSLPCCFKINSNHVAQKMCKNKIPFPTSNTPFLL